MPRTPAPSMWLREVFFDTTTSNGTLLILERGNVLIVTTKGEEISLPIEDLQEIGRAVLKRLQALLATALNAQSPSNKP